MLFLLHNWSIPVLVSFISSQMPSLRTLHLKGPCYGFAFLWWKKMKPFCDYLHSGMDFRGQRVVSHPLIYFKSHTFYSVGGRSRNKLKNTFIRWGKMRCYDCCNNQKTNLLFWLIVSFSFMAAAASTLIVQWNFLQRHGKTTTCWWWDCD